MTREELFSYVKEEYAQEPDYPFENDFETAVLRHSDTGKWFALVMYVRADKLSVVITLVLAFVFLHEEFSVKSFIGCVLIGAGTLCMVI